MFEYEINEDTLALVPESEEITRVYEWNQVFLVYQNANEIIEDSCLYFGSSLDGRRKGTENMIGINYKPPIIVEETKEIIFFPTSSSRYHTSAWIGLKYIKRYYRGEENVVIEFQNDQKLLLTISYGILNNQILRATRLESALRGRKTKKNV